MGGQSDSKRRSGSDAEQQNGWTAPWARGHGASLAKLVLTPEVVDALRETACNEAGLGSNEKEQCRVSRNLPDLCDHRVLRGWCISAEESWAGIVDRVDAEAGLLSEYCRIVREEQHRLYHLHLCSLVSMMSPFLVRVLSGVVRLNLRGHLCEVRSPEHDLVGGSPTDFEHDVGYPLALYVWDCLSAARVVEFTTSGAKATPLGRGRKSKYFGLASSVDSTIGFLQLLVLNCTSARIRSGALNYSPLAELLQMLGLARVVRVERSVCSRCGEDTTSSRHSGVCPGLPVRREARRLLATEYLNRRLPATEGVNSGVEAAAETAELLETMCRRVREVWRSARAQKERGLNKRAVYAALSKEAFDGNEPLPDELTDEQARCIFWGIRENTVEREGILKRATGLRRVLAGLREEGDSELTSTNIGVIVSRLKRSVLPEYSDNETG